MNEATGTAPSHHHHTTDILSIVIPVYNERATIAALVEQVQAAPAIPAKEIVIVDDGSTDGTTELLRTSIPGDNIVKLFHPKNRGKGAALRTGFQAARGNIILIQDADLEYDPEDYPKLLTPILSGQADVVYGSRFQGGDAHRVLYFRHFIGNRLLTLLSNMCTNINLSDMETGYKAFTRPVIDKLTLREERFGCDPEITAKIAKLHCRIFEVGISYNGRTYREGKKIGWQDGLRVLICILRYNLFPGNNHR
ncbi:MAG: glycosyltransferase family 2 protein [Desulfobulbaceae bacterium]|nr:glycosyltransferase family 2 protein [Desulfobulbaceae bacterium]